MRLPLPHRDESNGGIHKRKYMAEGDARAEFREVSKQAAQQVSKRGKPYSREDQRKIAREKWSEFCERHQAGEHG